MLKKLSWLLANAPPTVILDLCPVSLFATVPILIVESVEEVWMSSVVAAIDAVPMSIFWNPVARLPS